MFKELHGLARTFLSNMIIGVSMKKKELNLSLVGTGFTADVIERNFLLIC